jgi:photosystem II stability/assembly factor-like uncharacterized protein
MSDQLDLRQTEALLRAHYARSDAGGLRPELAARIGADLEARASGRSGGTRLHLEPVRAISPIGRFGLGWSLAAAAVVVVLVASGIAVGRLATPPTAASPSGIASPVTSASPSAASASGGTAGPSPSTPPVSPSSSTAASEQDAMAFADRQHGLVVGAYQGQGAIWSTADEGSTWTSTLVPTPPLDSVAVLGTRAWASASCAGIDGACTPAVVASDDSGATWTVVGSTPVTSLTFVSAAHGFGVEVSSPGPLGLLETTDGGRTWAAAAGAEPCDVGGPAAVSFTDARHGWVACRSGESAVGQSSKEVVETDDGGATWSVRSRVRLDNTGTLGELPTEGIFRGIQMLASGTGIAWLWNEGLIRTTDGGVTWTRLPLGDVAGDLQWPGAAIAPDGSLLALTVAVTSSSNGSATFNLGFEDGRTWKPYVEFGGLPAPGTTPTPEPTSPPQPAIADSGVAFFDASNGIAIGNDASHADLWRTADGGRTWTISPLAAPSAQLMATHGDRVWIATSSCAANPPDPTACTPAIERSDDRGATWRVIGHQSLSSMSFGDATHGFGVGPQPLPANGDTAAGLNTAIYATSDGGVTWTPLPNSRPCGKFDPVAVSFVSASRGWVGCSGVIGAGSGLKAVMETTDGGHSWSWRARIDYPGGLPDIGSITSSDYLQTIAMAADGSGFISGQRGSTIRTSDGGRTWTSCPPGQFDAFTTSAAAMTSGGSWYVVQSGWLNATLTTFESRLMRSDDHGATWTQVGGYLPHP